MHNAVAFPRNFSFWALVKTLLEVFGALWLIIEIASFFSTEFADGIKPKWWLFLVAGLLIGVYRGWPNLVVLARIYGTDTFVELRVTDMFKVPAAFVIGCNRTFDTSLEDDVISPDSTQGQYTQQFFSSRKDLDAQIQSSLQGNGSAIRLSNDKKPYGNQDEFPVGTVASVSSNGQVAYLVAIATLNEYKRASASTEDILVALPEIWEFIRNRGDLGPLCCPILGSAFSRVTATREDLIREIIKSFVAACRSGGFCEKLTIAIALADFQTGKVNLETLRRFVEYECLYPASLSAASQSRPTGTPA